MQDNYELMAIHCAQKGDQQAWAYLFDQHFLAVHSFCLKITQGQSNMAEDVTQEAFMHAALRIHRYESSQGSLRSWLFGIANNRYKKLITSRSRRLKRESQYVQNELEDLRANCHDTTDILEVLAHMSAKDRALLEAKYLDGKTIKDIAETFQISEHAAESRLRRARDRFTATYKKARRTSS